MKKNLPAFPAMMTLLAFLCFIAAYLFVTCYFIVPQYAKGLLFAVPFSVLSVVTLCAYFGKLGKVAASVLTGILSVLFVMGAFIFLIALGFLQGTPVEDASYYERTIACTTIDDRCPGLLPRHIPEDAENVVFYYTPQILQGSERFVLAFQTDDTAIASYETKLREHAIWIGTDEQAKADDKNIMINPLCLRTNEHYGAFPKEAMLYLLAARPDGYNHGMSYTVMLDYESNGIVFFFEQW